MAYQYRMYIYHSRALFLLIMNLANLTDLKTKIDNVPKDAGSEDVPELYHCGPGKLKESLNWEFQYGKRTRRYNMRIKECSSSGMILKCATTPKCKAKIKMKVNDPKLIISETKIEKSRYRTRYKLNYDHPDLKDISKYTVLTSLQAHCDFCKPIAKFHAVAKQFRSTNGQLSVDVNRDMTKDTFHNSNMLQIFCTDQLADRKEVNFSLKGEQFSAKMKIFNSQNYTFFKPWGGSLSEKFTSFRSAS